MASPRSSKKTVKKTPARAAKAVPAKKVASPAQKKAAAPAKKKTPPPSYIKRSASAKIPAQEAAPRVEKAESRPMVRLTLATRRSALAVKQAEMAAAHLKGRLADHEFELLELVTTGDEQENWSLEQQGGKGLFTGELEVALIEKRADAAVHSAKDLPTEMNAKLAIAGYLERGDPRDMLIIREDLPRAGSIATSSPRRRNQLQRQFTKAEFLEIRGNVQTRLKKIADGYADATVLAAAGLERLGITEWPGLRFQILPLAVCVPAAGQGAIAVQTRKDKVDTLRPHLDAATFRQVELEREFLCAMGAGCHTAFAVYFDGTAVHLYHDNCGFQRFSVTAEEMQRPRLVVNQILARLELNA